MIDQTLQRDLRAAAACRTRLGVMEAEMQSCLEQREAAYRQADSFLAEFDTLAEASRNMRAALAALERRMQRTGTYFVSEAQVDTLLSTIADVGADEAKFCHWFGVDSIPEIAAHDFDAAKAALEAKRTRVAA